MKSSILYLLILLTLIALTSSAQSEGSITDNSLIYVSKLGDNSDGSTWAKAFNTIQTALVNFQKLIL